MAFSSCPECGQTQHLEDAFGHRTFACGFASNGNRRQAQCRASRRRSSGPQAASDADSRYRLALLDAAQVAETIASDMLASGEGLEHARRCRDLARQMRAFAGHGRPVRSLEEFTLPEAKPLVGQQGYAPEGEPAARGQGSTIATIMRKVGAWRR